jgi:hypothetical protein
VIVINILPSLLGRGTGAAGGGENPAAAHFPSTTLRAVPLPICDGEDEE